MKTKEQILKWLDKQPWANEFHRAVFMLRTDLNLYYNESFILRAFRWGETEQGEDAWIMRDKEFRQWYNSNDKPLSWAEYCKQNPIKEGECYIDDVCCISAAATLGKQRNVDMDANIMSKDLCEAFLAYMKLIQLRNAWVKNGDENLYRIVWSPNRGFWCVRSGHNGLSFSTEDMADEFIGTFKDLLEVAKPLI